MFGHCDFETFLNRVLYVSYVQNSPSCVFYRQLCSQVEIAIVQDTLPADTYQSSTHKTASGIRIEAVDQQPNVLLQTAVPPQIISEPAQWTVGDRVQTVEFYSVILEELPLVIPFEFSLRARQEVTTWVVH